MTRKIDEPTYESFVREANEAYRLLETIELLIRVNAPLNDGGPTYRAVVKFLKKYAEGR